MLLVRELPFPYDPMLLVRELPFPYDPMLLVRELPFPYDPMLLKTAFVSLMLLIVFDYLIIQKLYLF
jgi:hypothetical protein